jgi:hypothetical protein
MAKEKIIYAGIAEIAIAVEVSRSVVISWVARRKDFPAPLVRLRMGPVWDLNEVLPWCNAVMRERVKKIDQRSTVLQQKLHGLDTLREKLMKAKEGE